MTLQSLNWVVVVFVTYLANEGYTPILFENPLIPLLAIVAYIMLIGILMANRELRNDYPSNYAVYLGSSVFLGLFFGSLAAEIK